MAVKRVKKIVNVEETEILVDCECGCGRKDVPIDKCFKCKGCEKVYPDSCVSYHSKDLFTGEEEYDDCFHYYCFGCENVAKIGFDEMYKTLREYDDRVERELDKLVSGEIGKGLDRYAFNRSRRKNNNETNPV